MKTNEIIKQVVKDGIITEGQINLIKNRMNRGEKVDLSEIYDNEIGITKEQTAKGLNFLLNLWKTPTGAERKNNPFGYRETEALETFEAFYFNGFYDASRYDMRPVYLPLYVVCGKECNFEYYYNGKVNIIG